MPQSWIYHGSYSSKSKILTHLPEEKVFRKLWLCHSPKLRHCESDCDVGSNLWRRQENEELARWRLQLYLCTTRIAYGKIRYCHSRAVENHQSFVRILLNNVRSSTYLPLNWNESHCIWLHNIDYNQTKGKHMYALSDLFRYYSRMSNNKMCTSSADCFLWAGEWNVVTVYSLVDICVRQIVNGVCRADATRSRAKLRIRNNHQQQWYALFESKSSLALHKTCFTTNIDDRSFHTCRLSVTCWPVRLTACTAFILGLTDAGFTDVRK